MTCPLPHRNPAEPDPGYIICRRHLTRLTEHLTAIAVILDDLDELLVSPPPMDANDARSARCDPPAPCRLDVLDLTDKRSDTPALYLVASWCLLVSDERQLSGIPSWPSSQARWLIRHVDWIGHHPAADDCAREMADAWRWLTTAAGMHPSPPLFSCPVVHPDAEGECGGPVRAELTTFGVRCAKCGERWDGNERLARFGALESAEIVARVTTV